MARSALAYGEREYRRGKQPAEGLIDKMGIADRAKVARRQRVSGKIRVNIKVELIISGSPTSNVLNSSTRKSYIASNQTPQVPNGDTLESARTNELDADKVSLKKETSVANVGENSECAKS